MDSIILHVIRQWSSVMSIRRYVTRPRQEQMRPRHATFNTDSFQKNVSRPRSSSHNYHYYYEPFRRNGSTTSDIFG